MDISDLIKVLSQDPITRERITCTQSLSDAVYSPCAGVGVSVAPHTHHPGDGRLPGETARRRERALHSAADAGLSGEGGGDSTETSLKAPLSNVTSVF